jgi:hypothetical protein
MNAHRCTALCVTAFAIEYRHRPLDEQLNSGIRQIELDIRSRRLYTVNTTQDRLYGSEKDSK